MPSRFPFLTRAPMLVAPLIASTLVAVAPLSAHAAGFSVWIPPAPPQAYNYSQCSSFQWDGSTLACVLANNPPPPPPPPPSGTPFAGCPADALKIDNQWGNTSISSWEFGYFSTNILSVRIAVPANATGTNVRTSSWVEYGTGPIVREAVLSTTACDFSNANALKTSFGVAMRNQANSLSFSAKYTLGNATSTAVKLVPGQVYYINIRNRYSDGTPSCAMVACSMRGGLPK